jgi:hypothetical protein
MRNRWFLVAIFLSVLGIIFYFVNLVVFIPRFSAFRDATLAWVQAHNNNAMPNPVDFGWDYSSAVVSVFLSYASWILLLVGGGYLLIQFISRIIRLLGYMKDNGT